MSSLPEEYDPTIPRATTVLRAVSTLAPNPAKFFPQYPPEPTGYYRKRGNFLDQCGAIVTQGLELDDRTMALLSQRRERPLVSPEATDDERFESWAEYLWPFQAWLQRHKVKYVDSQRYVVNRTLWVQGRYDLKLWVDDKLTRIDFKCSAAMPEYTRFQLAIYDLCDEPTCRLGIQLTRGKCIEHPYSDHRDYNRVRNWLGAYNSMQDYK